MRCETSQGSNVRSLVKFGCDHLFLGRSLNGCEQRAPLKRYQVGQAAGGVGCIGPRAAQGYLKSRGFELNSPEGFTLAQLVKS